MANTNISYINYISEKMLHARKTPAGREFVSVSVACPASSNGYGTFAVGTKQVFDSTRKDKTVVTGFKNILLGNPEKTRKVSIKTPEGTYENVEMTNEDIAEMFTAERDAYTASLKAAEPAPAITEA